MATCQNCGAIVSTMHGHTVANKATPTYRAWTNMIARCTQPSAARFHRYGGRGISVCDRWLHSFPNFLADMGDRPEGMTLERIDVNENYGPSNCRWATTEEQRQNRSDNRVLVLNGRSMPCFMWAKELGISADVLRSRLHRGWSDERALTQKVRGQQ